MSCAGRPLNGAGGKKCFPVPVSFGINSRCSRAASQNGRVHSSGAMPEIEAGSRPEIRFVALVIAVSLLEDDGAVGDAGRASGHERQFCALDLVGRRPTQLVDTL